MTVWATSVVIDWNALAANADAGSFPAFGPQGQLPVPKQPILGVPTAVYLAESSLRPSAIRAGGASIS